MVHAEALRLGLERPLQEASRAQSAGRSLIKLQAGSAQFHRDPVGVYHYNTHCEVIGTIEHSRIQ
jgi:hypothetical protein